MPDSPVSAATLDRLFARGERLGWVFRDRRPSLRGFAVPPPAPEPIPAHIAYRYEQYRASFNSSLLTAVVGGLAAACVLPTALTLIIGLSTDATRWDTLPPPFVFIGALTGVVVVIALVVVAAVVGRHRGAAHAMDTARRVVHQRWEAQTRQWERDKAAFEEAELARVDALSEWFPVRRTENTGRLDVIGGSLWGWEAFVTVFGASMVSTHAPVTIVDLSGQALGTELAGLAAARGFAVHQQHLPRDLARSDLLTGLSPREFAASLVESMHLHDDRHAERSMDDRLLMAVCAVLGDNLTLARLGAALGVLMNPSEGHPELTAEELTALAGGLFSDEYRRQSHAQLRRIESDVDALRELGTKPVPHPSVVSCLMLSPDGLTAQFELLRGLILQQVARDVAGRCAPRSLLIVGADDLPLRYVERLSDSCARREVRLTLLYRHLRQTTLQAVGAGAVAFMRLGNHLEAAAAAEFVGREHKFVLTQVTTTVGGSASHGHAETEGQTASVGVATTGVFSMAAGRNWSATRSWVEGSQWSNAQAHHRVYEYAVEPSVLQHLPDYALLLVQTRTAAAPSLLAVECNPEIATLPGVSDTP